MGKKIVSILVLMLCLGLIMAGCPKKTVVKEEPSIKQEEALVEPPRAEARGSSTCFVGYPQRIHPRPRRPWLSA